MALTAHGTQANKTGNMLESTVQHVFLQKGFTLRTYKEYAQASFTEPEDVLIKHAPYTTIYGHQGKTEFLALSPSRDLTMRIECKWQQSSGSVDEKFPYLIENCKIMPEPSMLILIDGNGYKPGALNWLKQAAAACDTKKILVMNLMEFMIWANTHL